METKQTSEFATTATSTVDVDEQLITSCQQYFDQKIVFKPASQPDLYLEHLQSRYRPLNPIMPEQNHQNSTSNSPTNSSKEGSQKSVDGGRENTTDGIPSPKRVLYDPAQLEMKWLAPRGVGAGLGNMGNTCFLNSVLQCLTYTPPLYNYLASDHHKNNCRSQGFCAMCELQRHIQRVLSQGSGVVRPMAIVQNLRVIGKHFRQGRQEDAHEFLRYFVDGLQKSSLQGVSAKLDPHSKATTVIHQVFGGYHCSQVRCMKCQKTSETFDPLLDLSLDIKTCSTLIQALNRFTKPDSLEGDNQYACPYCKKMTPALKRFTIHRLPNILTIQLKRFDYNSLFGGKVNKPVSYPQQLDMRPYMTAKKGPPQWYQLYGVLVHSGYSCRSGHYYCYVRSSNKVWHCLNDSQVYQVSANQVLQQEAYLLFYARDLEYQPSASPVQPKPLVSPNLPQTKVRPDPNFLGQPVKRPPGVDKTGTLLVKHKPTGIVPPSPQALSATPTQSFPRPSSTLPLRKSDIDKTPAPPTPVVTPPSKPTNVLVKRPSFVPRVIATPSSKKKKVQVVKSIGSNDKLHETAQSDSQLGVADVSTGNDEVERDNHTGAPGADQTTEMFIGPCLPPHMQSPYRYPALLSTLKIARVQPQVKPNKPVALVHPVVPDSPRGKTREKLIFAGLGACRGAQQTAANRTPQMQNFRSQWKPVDTPAPASTSSHQQTPDLESAEKNSDAHARATEAELMPETKKRKKHKKKRSHKNEEQDERGEGERSRKHHKGDDVKSTKHTHCVERSEDEQRPRKRRKTHESRKEKKKSRHHFSHRRERERSCSSTTDESSDRQHHRNEHSRREDKTHREGGKREIGHRDREQSHREERKHEGKQQQRRSSSGCQSGHKARHHSPSPDRSKRKRHWSSDSDDSHIRRKSLKQVSDHAHKKHHSSAHHHKHHEKIVKSKHLSEKIKSVCSGELRTDAGCASVEERDVLKSCSSAHATPSSEGRKSKSVEKKREGSSTVPEIEWDASLRVEGKGGRGVPAGAKWDGSRSHAIVEALTSHAPNQLGAKVKSWEGGENSVDTVSVPGEWKQKERDLWDQELDRGKVKHVKTRKENDFPLKNPFQEFQNKKNTKNNLRTN